MKERMAERGVLERDPARLKETMARLQRPGTPLLRLAISVLLVVYLVLIIAVPVAVSAWPVGFARTHAERLFCLLVAPVIYAVAYPVVCGLLARMTVRALVPGKMPRDLGHFVYGPRRLHALCWTAIYYNPPVLHAVFSLPLLKRVVFRLFGYGGSLDATFYPDVWMRDLPLLEIGSRAYIANRVTLGTNICLQDGQIVVNRIKIGAGAMVGHATILALGDDIGDGVMIGARTTIGANVQIGPGSHVGDLAGINHGAKIGADCRIDSATWIGKKVVIHDGIRIRFGSVVPDGAVVRTQKDADAFSPQPVVATASLRAVAQIESVG